ncbi:hypothetical protein ACYVVD_10920 [Arenicellales bacterium IMCC58067]
MTLCDLVEQAATLGYHQTVISLNNVVANDIPERFAGASAEVFVIGRLQLLTVNRTLTWLDKTTSENHGKVSTV